MVGPSDNGPGPRVLNTRRLVHPWAWKGHLRVDSGSGCGRSGGGTARASQVEETGEHASCGGTACDDRTLASTSDPGVGILFPI